jgi:pimeloyl-ACP methyl ester carboxylesterase
MQSTENAARNAGRAHERQAPNTARIRVLGAILAGLLVTACATSARRADDVAANAGFIKRIAAGDPYRHLTYAAPGGNEGPLWVYIEGDGIPWLTEYVPAADPTPRTLVALEAMAAGGRPALYLGRPCYFDVNRDSGCGPLVWTHRRFAPEVTASMAGALRERIEAQRWQARPIILVGFSGGGTLATLMAQHVDNVCALITLASPLDVGEWASARGYSPLDGSDDPALAPSLPPDIAQLHMRGLLDRTVEAGNGARFLQRHPRAELRVLNDAAHGGEWVGIWRALLKTPGGLPVARCDPAAAR